ncbi:MAG: methylenetetrahydrofolate reductase [NAD(P)H] [Gammaproteobacteria bacterium]|nr:methylenetetrahydrofolate reductase [NAD(P)H] [Gammaproteobacteria bacterium]MBI5617556.1 methylenetetrahydrofolate reductase [NAD(P)H] [Gammaproteobacteria bacterium]
MTVQRPHVSLSFEFFPPRSPEAVGKLEATRIRLARLRPEFFSVTFGAGGSTKELTLETALATRAATGIDTAPHISCMGTPLAQIRSVLAQYREAGVKRVVALRGDMPSGTTGFGELRYGNELVAFIRAETGRDFVIEVAAYPEFHPQAPSAELDLLNFKRKVEAGADGAITQYFYNPDAYFRFVDSVRRLGVEIPIIPGVMPITNFSQLSRFSEMCGAEIPRWIVKRLRDFGDDRLAIRNFGIDVTTELCARLVERGAPGLHFYTMNQYEASEAVCRNLGLGADGDVVRA